MSQLTHDLDVRERVDQDQLREVVKAIESMGWKYLRMTHPNCINPRVYYLEVYIPEDTSEEAEEAEVQSPYAEFVSGKRVEAVCERCHGLFAVENVNERFTCRRCAGEQREAVDCEDSGFVSGSCGALRFLEIGEAINPSKSLALEVHCDRLPGHRGQHMARVANQVWTW